MRLRSDLPLPPPPASNRRLPRSGRLPGKWRSREPGVPSMRSGGASFLGTPLRGSHRLSRRTIPRRRRRPRQPPLSALTATCRRRRVRGNETTFLLAFRVRGRHTETAETRARKTVDITDVLDPSSTPGQRGSPRRGTPGHTRAVLTPQRPALGSGADPSPIRERQDATGAPSLPVTTPHPPRYKNGSRRHRFSSSNGKSASRQALREGRPASPLMNRCGEEGGDTK